MNESPQLSREEIRRRAQAAAGPRAKLRLLGIDDSYFDNLLDGHPVNENDFETLWKLLYAVNRLDLLDIHHWSESNRGFKLAELSEFPVARRGQVFPLQGFVRRVTRHRPLPEVVRQLEMEEYFRCELTLNDTDVPAVAFAREVPSAWKLDEEIKERATLDGVFLKLAGGGDDPPTPVFVARRVAWHPPTLLGDLRVDVGLFDRVINRTRLGGRDRECFYQLLNVLGRIGDDRIHAAAAAALEDVNERRQAKKRKQPGQFSVVHVLRHAQDQRNLRLETRRVEEAAKSARRMVAKNEEFIEVHKTMAERKRAGENVMALEALAALRAQERDAIGKKLHERLSQLDPQPPQFAAGTAPAAAAAGKIIPWTRTRLRELADDHRKLAESAYHQGRFMVFNGTARRVTKIRVEDDSVVARYGVDHYYEMEVFVDLGGRYTLYKDSKRQFTEYPVVCCFRELPPGMSAEEDKISLPVRVSGALFKIWTYRSGFSEEHGEDSRQLAPLLIGRAPLLLQQPETSSIPYIGLIAGGLFVLAMATIWFGLWRFSRGDRKFEQQVISRQFAPEEGTSLDDLQVGEEK